MMALALAACGPSLAACGRAEAVPPPAIQPPPGWQPLADVATAASEAAKADGATVDSAAAWGETAMGCYVVTLAVHGAGSPEAIGKELAVAGVHDVAAGSDSVALAFDKAGYHGKLRAHVGDSIDVVACYWNDREPEACANACAGMLK
jgi:hypothetical protein